VTTPKSALTLPSRTPAYVSRETGAAEIGISPATWDAWVKAGVLASGSAWSSRINAALAMGGRRQQTLRTEI
jgi:hypothetical protein